MSAPSVFELSGVAIFALAAAPLGVFLNLRRLSLMGDAIAHGMLPGVAAGAILAAGAGWAMAAGGLVAALIVAAAASFLSSAMRQNEDTAIAALYLIALALGGALLAKAGGALDLEHVLFGDAQSLTRQHVLGLALAASASALGLAFLWPALALDTVDADAFAARPLLRFLARGGFFACLALVLVAGFQAMGVLMSVGLVVLPAAAARVFARSVGEMTALAMAIGLAAALAGSALAHALGIPSGSAMALVAASAYLGAALLTRRARL